MNRRILILILFFSAVPSIAQVRIRIFSEFSPEDALLTVTSGSYYLISAGDSLVIPPKNPVHISVLGGKVAVKPHNSPGYLCDSVIIGPATDDCSFSIKIRREAQVIRHYTGSLSCYPFHGSILLVNTADIEQYVAGVVRTEGGTRQHPEYFKTQAVIARTYLYKFFTRHSSDHYNLCDNTHCQAFNGRSTEKDIIEAAKETHNLVILDSSRNIIHSAFHSNCGGETCASEDVWLTDLAYLKKVTDPYCRKSLNATWQKTISTDLWRDYLSKAGMDSSTENPPAFDFVQNRRLTLYRSGSFVYPLQVIRKDFDLKSSFFSVKTNGSTVTLYGRGYGHGVGLCQEGAMAMASKGFNFREIISFYYTGVILSDIPQTAEK